MNTIAKLAIAAICTTAFACDEHKTHQQPVAQGKAAVAQTENASVLKAVLSVQGACEMCKMKIEGTAKSVEGVKAAVWNLEAKTLMLEYDSGKTSPNAVSKAIAAVGYDTEMDKASDAVYNALPGCCKYRN